MTERQFQTCLERGARSEGFHVTPIPDGGRAGAQRVYDLVLTRSGQGHHIELKTIKGRAQSFGFRQLQAHQEKNLLSAKAAGGIGWVGIFIQIRAGRELSRFLGVERGAKFEAFYVVEITKLLALRDEEFWTSVPVIWIINHGIFLGQLESEFSPEGKELKRWSALLMDQDEWTANVLSEAERVWMEAGDE